MFRIFILFIMIMGISILNCYADEQENLKLCKAVESLAAEIMDCRQSGVQMSKTMEIANGNKMLIMFIEEAYNSPKYRVESNRKEANIEFGNKAYLRCMKAREKK